MILNYQKKKCQITKIFKDFRVLPWIRTYVFPLPTLRSQGRVKWFNKRRGFGFIVNVDDTTKEYFCHHSAVNPNTNCWRILHEGEYVEFDLENGKQGEQCVNVTGLRGGPLRCDLIVDKSRNRPVESHIIHENKVE